ncbi:MAG: glycosyltransferase family 39 protein [Mycobacteriaceae bacterium]
MTIVSNSAGIKSFKDSGKGEKLALSFLLIGTAVLYIWGLGASGWANSFYSAAVQAGSQSWKAFFFGSSDAANSITVDKPPMSLWPMELSVRIFGLSSWSILVPQALMGVASVALLWFMVRRYFGPLAAFISGLALALTPVAVLMFRFNNPDALLVLLMIAAAWAMLRAIESQKIKWLVLVGVLVGFGFLTKQLQAFLIIPPLALSYLVAGPSGVLKRCVNLLVPLGAMIVSAGWWIAIVELWPASSRPWIGGSQNNSILELTLSYNGFGRLNGNEVGSAGGGMSAADMPGGSGSMWGESGITRLFDSAQGGQISWLIPAALVLLGIGIILRGKAPLIDLKRAAMILWGSWLISTGLVFSFMKGIFHAYYTVALAPALAAVIGAGFSLSWSNREKLWVRIILTVAIIATGVTAYVFLDRSPDYLPWLKWVIAIASVVAAVWFLISTQSWAPRQLAVAGIAALIIASLSGPTAYALTTATHVHEGSIPSAGPQVSGGFGPGRGPGPDGFRDGPPRREGVGAMPPGFPGELPAGPIGGAGGLLNASKPSADLIQLLLADADDFTWVAAAIGSNSASGFQLATEYPVMPIGGFNGSDPSPSLAQFQSYVAAHQIHYFISSGFGMGGNSASGNGIASWVEETFIAKTVGIVTVYDLTIPKNSGS